MAWLIPKTPSPSLLLTTSVALSWCCLGWRQSHHNLYFDCTQNHTIHTTTRKHTLQKHCSSWGAYVATCGLPHFQPKNGGTGTALEQTSRWWGKLTWLQHLHGSNGNCSLLVDRKASTPSHPQQLLLSLHHNNYTWWNATGNKKLDLPTHSSITKHWMESYLMYQEHSPQSCSLVVIWLYFS